MHFTISVVVASSAHFRRWFSIHSRLENTDAIGQADSGSRGRNVEQHNPAGDFP
jgi:hypothetical protein